MDCTCHENRTRTQQMHRATSSHYKCMKPSGRLSIVSLSGVADPSLTSEGSVMPLSSQTWQGTVICDSPWNRKGIASYSILSTNMKKQHQRASAGTTTSSELGQLLVQP